MLVYIHIYTCNKISKYIHSQVSKSPTMKMTYLYAYIHIYVYDIHIHTYTDIIHMKRYTHVYM